MVKHIGNQLLREIDLAKADLKSAKNWGIYDMFFSSSMLSSCIKHSKVNSSKERIRTIKRLLLDFEKELEEIDSIRLNETDITTLDAFVDIFLDNIFIDFFVQSKINDNYNSLVRLENAIKNILKDI